MKLPIILAVTAVFSGGGRIRRYPASAFHAHPAAATDPASAAIDGYSVCRFAGYQ
ncbi:MULTISPECIES: hypothetical protein [Acidithiobacillus]|jgi:hypothetical protein|uniref:hypothetical protein n=1 Tax=Acidithiobacillus TaxID=119977 RepID=UPI001D012098|nr:MULTISPECIES: hypothetical protein [Acidithiobacillus]